MDVHEALRELYQEKARLDALIARLERAEASNIYAVGSSRRSRGRKMMTAEERRAVSERMRHYWADRKAAGDNGEDVRATA